MPVPLGCHTLSVWRSATVYSDESKVQHNTTLLSLCREICILARRLHKTVNIFNNKTSTTQWNTEIKTTQIQGKFLTIAMYTRTHGGMHVPTPPTPPHPHTHRSGNSFIMTKKGHFHILFYCLNSLICCSFPFLFVLNVSLLLGTADAEILRSPLLKPQSWRMFSLKSTEYVRI